MTADETTNTPAAARNSERRYDHAVAVGSTARRPESRPVNDAGGGTAYEVGGAPSAAPVYTTNAVDPDGRTIYFDDLVGDGERVEVEGRQMRVHYAPGDGEGEWLVAPAAAYVRSKSGAWHVVASEGPGERVITDCGLALNGGLIDTLPPRRPRTRPCLSCRWPEGYPKWRMPDGQLAATGEGELTLGN